MIITILFVLIVLWLLGLLTHIGGGLINLLLLVALIGLVYDLIARRRV
jgi:hypothetical protein